MGKSAGYLTKIKKALAKLGQGAIKVVNKYDLFKPIRPYLPQPAPLVKPNMTPNMPWVHPHEKYMREILMPRQEENIRRYRDQLPLNDYQKQFNMISKNNQVETVNKPRYSDDSVPLPNSIKWEEEGIFKQPSDGWYAPPASEMKRRIDLNNNKYYIPSQEMNRRDNIYHKNPPIPGLKNPTNKKRRDELNLPPNPGKFELN